MTAPIGETGASEGESERVDRRELRRARRAKREIQKRKLNAVFERRDLEVSALVSLLEARRNGRINSAALLPTNAEKRFAVYSTFCGATENMTFRDTQVPKVVPHFFISNNQQVLERAERHGWLPIALDLEVSESMVLSAQQAKVAKALPHIFSELRPYDYTLYVDDKITFSYDLIEGFISEMDQRNAAFGIRAHPFLEGSILLEYSEAMKQARYKAQEHQIVRYIHQKIADGYTLAPKNLFWTNYILRDMSHHLTNQFNETWYNDILDCGIEFQISFDFLAQRNQAIWLLPESL